MTEWNPTLYDQHHKFVSDFAENLVSSLNPQRDEHILDIGCGTGDLANAISKSGATVTGIDMSQSMIEVARRSILILTFSSWTLSTLLLISRFMRYFLMPPCTGCRTKLKSCNIVIMCYVPVVVSSLN